MKSNDLYSKDSPFEAPLIGLMNLTAGSDKETYHFELSLAGSGMEYSPGDSLAALPTNCPDVLGEVLGAAGFSGSEEVVSPNGEEKTLGEALTADYSITQLTSNLMKRHAALAESKKLDDLLLRENRDDLVEYMQGRELVDLLEDFPVPGLSPTDFIGLLREMPPRLYSISSSLLAHPEEVHLTVAIVRYHSHGRDRKGVCSTYLADRVEKTVPCYAHPNNKFKLPEDPATPIIMVGPGTGIAPFRAFLEERVALGATGNSWLFFGDRRSQTDFLYGDQLSDYLREKSLTRLDLAFSRDQGYKIYVQDRMRQNASELFSWIQDGAFFYVCGDASRMAKDVDQALIEIVAQEGGMDEQAAAAYVKAMRKEKRYLRDVY